MKTIYLTVILSFVCVYSFSQGHSRRFLNYRVAHQNLTNQKKAKTDGYTTFNFKYVFKNNQPYGKSAFVVYDDFYKTYTITFTKENGESTGCSLKDGNFIDLNYLLEYQGWKFKYQGAIYLME
jgi:hypothetical protein